MTVVLLLLSKPDSVSLKSAAGGSRDWRLKLPRWQHKWLAVDSTLDESRGFDLDDASLCSSATQSWSGHDREAISLLGMEISYGMETLPLLGPGDEYKSIK